MPSIADILIEGRDVDKAKLRGYLAAREIVSAKDPAFGAVGDGIHLARPPAATKMTNTFARMWQLLRSNFISKRRRSPLRTERRVGQAAASSSLRRFRDTFGFLMVT